jgi:hypothetical protein
MLIMSNMATPDRKANIRQSFLNQIQKIGILSYIYLLPYSERSAILKIKNMVVPRKTGKVTSASSPQIMRGCAVAKP